MNKKMTADKATMDEGSVTKPLEDVLMSEYSILI